MARTRLSIWPAVRNTCGDRAMRTLIGVVQADASRSDMNVSASSFTWDSTAEIRLLLYGLERGLGGDPLIHQPLGFLQLGDLAFHAALRRFDHVVGHLLAQVLHRQFAVKSPRENQVVLCIRKLLFRFFEPN